MAKADNISANEQERSMQMQDRVVLITGAASGIGAAAARAFAAEGARVVLSDINAAAGEALARELGGSFIAADVTSEEQVAAAVGFAVQQHGRLDCMVNCAGMGPHVYSVPKHGVVALTRTAATEMAQYGVRVNAIAPGLVVTPLVDQVYGTREASLSGAAQASPLGSAAMPEEIARSLVYLASDEAQHVTAHVLVVDSGVSVAGSSASALFHDRPTGFMGKLPE